VTDDKQKAREAKWAADRQADKERRQALKDKKRSVSQERRAEQKSGQAAREYGRGKQPIPDANSPGGFKTCTHYKGAQMVFNKTDKRWRYCMACGGTGNALQ
jgi:hypothetical protein